tara:strand:+ start:6352 stop:6960 length:609 start_codon:yes stop_codon:yes gene_type:complete
MRHAKKNNHLSRKAPHRKAMLSNMACSLLKYKRIKTTLAKAKALRIYIEPLISKSKNDTTHSRRVVFSYLKQKEVVTELFGDIATKIAERPGGYTRIIRLRNRIGDNSKLCFIELVDYNEVYTKDNTEKKSKRRRSRSKTKVVNDIKENEISLSKTSDKKAHKEVDNSKSESSVVVSKDTEMLDVKTDSEILESKKDEKNPK